MPLQINGAYTLRPSPFMNESRQIVEMQFCAGSSTPWYWTQQRSSSGACYRYESRWIRPAGIPGISFAKLTRVFESKVQNADDLCRSVLVRGLTGLIRQYFELRVSCHHRPHTSGRLLACWKLGRFDAFGRGVTEVLRTGGVQVEPHP